MSDERAYEDPLGFTDRTEFILKGLGVSSIAESIKKRNIATEDLPKLTKEDLIALGANEDRVPSLLKQLKVLPNRQTKDFLSEHKLRYFPDLLKESNRHLTMIETYVTFILLNLRDRRNKEIDNDFRDGKAIVEATNYLLKETGLMETDFQQLKNDFLPENDEFKLKSGIVLSVTCAAIATGGILWYLFRK